MDTIFHGGPVVTMDPSGRVARALAVRDGKVAALGTDEEVLALKTSATRVVDLRGASLMPGFIDSHSHLVFSARKLAAVPMESPPIAGIESISDICSSLSAKLRSAADCATKACWSQVAANRSSATSIGLPVCFARCSAVFSA